MSDDGNFLIVNNVINKDPKEKKTYKIYSLESDMKVIEKYETKKELNFHFNIFGKYLIVQQDRDLDLIYILKDKTEKIKMISLNSTTVEQISNIQWSSCGKFVFIFSQKSKIIKIMD